MAYNQETVLSDEAFLVSQTDSKGNIIFANKEFLNAAEYTLDEVLGKPHNIIRHEDMPKWAFKELWDTVKKGDVWQGYVKNSTKSDGFYWVYATVYPYKDKNNNQAYISCRRKANKEELVKIEQMYKTMS